MNSDLNKNVKLDMVSADDMTEEERKEVFNREATVDAIPDLDILTGHIYDILKYLEQPDTIELLDTNPGFVQMLLNKKYADSNIPYGLITLMMDRENQHEHIDRMLRMFKLLNDAKRNDISLDDADRIFTEDVNQIEYNKYGSKEAFEKAMASAVQSERINKSKQNAESLRNTGKAKFNN
jgi:hypothetical protein